MGQVNLGKEVGGGVVELLQPKYWIRTRELAVTSSVPR